MKISVIVPVYNQRQFLDECVDSILAQTYRNIELVLVDDGSTDGCAQRCDEIARSDSRVMVIHQPNQGLSMARNNGAGVASGEFVFFVDSDDVVHPQTLQRLVSLLSETGAHAAIGLMTTNPLPDNDLNGRVEVLSVSEAIRKTLYQDTINNSLCGKLLPRAKVLASPQRAGEGFEDLDTFYRIYESLGGNIAVLYSPVYYYRQHSDSFIHIFSPERMRVLDVTDRIVRHYAEDPTMFPAARDRRFSANYDMFILASQNGYPDTADRCWQVIRRYRCQELLDSRVRLKNKVGALVSYLGRPLVLALAKFRNKT